MASSKRGLQCPYCRQKANKVSQGDHSLSYRCDTPACAMDTFSLKLDMLMAEAEVAEQARRG